MHKCGTVGSIHEGHGPSKWYALIFGASDTSMPPCVFFMSLQVGTPRLLHSGSSDSLLQEKFHRLKYCAGHSFIGVLSYLQCNFKGQLTYFHGYMCTAQLAPRECHRYYGNTC